MAPKFATLPSAPETYLAAIPVAIAKYLDRVLFDDANPTETIWNDPSGAIAPPESGDLIYSGWIGIPSINSPSAQTPTVDRSSVVVEVTLRIAGNDAMVLPLLAADRARQLQEAMAALAISSLKKTGYDLSGTYRGFTFIADHKLKITASTPQWRNTVVTNQGSQNGQIGGVAVIRRAWTVETFEL